MSRARETADVVESKNQCTAWCTFDSTSTGTNAPIDGFNVASVTRNSIGHYTINLTNPLDNTNGSVTVLSNGYRVISYIFASTSTINVFMRDQSELEADGGVVSLQVFGGKD